MNFRNLRKGPIIGVDVQEREDDEIVNLGAQTRLVKHGEVGDFDVKSKAVQIYAKAKYLEPTTDEGRKWLKGLK